MKRCLAFLLALCLLAGILSGCTPSRALSQSQAVPANTAAQDDEDSSVRLDAPAEEPAFSILFLDVGQADCMLVTCDGQHMLVDGGNVDDSRLVAAVLKRKGIDYLDYVVCTHAHEDHAGGLAGALNVCSFGTALAPVKTSKNIPFSNFVKYVKKQSKAITVPTCDEEFPLGSATVKVLGPRRTYDDVNDSSLVFMITYGSTRFLLTGDMERDAEQDLIDDGCDLKADLLKVGHHGSVTSTSYVFLNEVMPEIAVIQVGEGNDYGHPRDEVLTRLRDADVTLYRTDLQGDVLAVSDGETVTVTPFKNPDAETNPTFYNSEGQNAIDVAYIGNLNSKKFHRPSCPNLPAEENRTFFNNRTEAVGAGYIPCGQCKP